MNLIKDILSKIIPIIIIIVIIILLILGVGFAIKLKEQMDLSKYTEFQNNVTAVIEKIHQINDEGSQRLGLDVSNTQLNETYFQQIQEIKNLFNIDINTNGYVYLDANHKHFLQLDEIEGTYIINYDEGIVFCLDMITYKNVKYFTTYDLQKRLLNDYSYDFPIIPKGFEHILGNWDTGYVIQDEFKNEFVWIPVGMLNKNTTEAFKQYYRQVKDIESNTEEYKKIIESINKYGGFYVARYEASLKGATDKSSIGTSNVLQSARNVIPISQVSFTIPNTEDVGRGYNAEGKSVEIGERKGAVELANSMAYDYKWNEQGISTCLMYGEHYDTILYIINKLNLLSDKQNNDLNPIVEDSSLWGNYINSEFRYEKNNQLVLKQKNQGILLPTGTDIYKLDEDVVSNANKVFNIYDLAGNLLEWTIDTYRDDIIIRGGCYVSNGKLNNVSEYIPQNIQYCSGELGIRVVMYID